MTIDALPQVTDDQLPVSLADHVRGLDDAGVDARFHRYMAHSERAANLYWAEFYPRLFAEGALPRRTKELVRLVLAGVSGCHFCQAQDVASALAHGITQVEIDAVLALDLSALPEADAVAADLAYRLSPFHDGDSLSDEDWARLRGHFDDEQVAELLMCASVLAGVGRMLVVTGFVPRDCPVPETLE